jgi:hypothetical protein
MLGLPSRSLQMDVRGAMFKKKKERKKPQSAELAGGAGFTFEDAVAAYYLAALLGEGYARGMENLTVTRVALQQRNFGEPLDDVIVDSKDVSGELSRLSLQVKRKLIISAAKSNTDFSDIVRDSWLTYRKPDFRSGVDQYGAAVGGVAESKKRDLIRLCETARESVTTEHFEARFAFRGGASGAVKSIRKDIVKLLKAANGAKPSAADVHGFLSHFVLLEFDFLYSGAADPPEVMTGLRGCLASNSAAQAPLLWTKLREKAQDSSGKSGEYYRSRLVRELSQVIHLRVASSLKKDVEQITALARDWIADIQNDVAGTHVQRPAIVSTVNKALNDTRFVQLTGLPGSGKSALLRHHVDQDLSRGPVVFLHSDRLQGKGWASFAAANGLSAVPLENLLTEIGAIGSSTLFIDGIDRVGNDHRGVVLDILRPIIESPLLKNWKVLVSLRDTGMAPLRNWLEPLLSKVQIATVDVPSLSDDEAAALANEKPALQSLLFGPQPVRDVVRRPFFAKILNQSVTDSSASPAFEPKSEVDLIENWWARGGYNAVAPEILKRQRAIVEIGSLRARQLSQPIRIGQLRPESINVIDQLVVDGILQHVRQGHTIRFSHDIFFEWSFFEVLVGHDQQWPTEIRACGEPPAVARVVELLSQSEYTHGKSWACALYGISAQKMRSQWLRAWLLGPIGLALFEKNEEPFYATVSADGFKLLKKAIVWYQAEKTTPNTNILKSDMPPDRRQRMADLFGWPSDLLAWRRFVVFLLRRADSLPVALYPDVLSMFEVWQNTVGTAQNPVTQAIVTKCAEWLRELDALPEMPGATSRWGSLKERSDFRKSLSSLILRTAPAMPKATEEYIRRVMGQRELRRERYKEVIDFSPILCNTHPGLLVDLTLRHLKEELPDDKIEQERKREQRATEIRSRILAKPESERSEREKRYIEGGAHVFPLGAAQFSIMEWNELAIANDSETFFPPSPLREPFHSLFKTAPDCALTLFKDLCNHAVAAWRQLHQHLHDSPGTPVPLEIQFPWGVQQFWGGDREYLWHRGFFGPRAVVAGFMALEEWCFAELAKGRPVEELFRQIVEGNKSIAILGVAVMMALHTRSLSETVFPMVMTQRLWRADRGRRREDMSSAVANLMGFRSSDDLPHVNAIKAASARAVRKQQLSELAPDYLFSNQFGDRTKAAVKAFPTDLPFQYEEHRSNAQARQYYLDQAHEYAELADMTTWRAISAPDKDGQVQVAHVSPAASKPQRVKEVERAALFLQESNLWVWASNSFKAGKVENPERLPAAIMLARKLDEPSLYKDVAKEGDDGTRKGAVAAAAAMVLAFREGRTDEELKWARDVLMRAAEAPEVSDSWTIAQSLIPWHHKIFAVQGFAADVREGTGSAEEKEGLLALSCHPLECVGLAALEAMGGLWESDRKLVWTALYLGLALCHIEPLPPASAGGRRNARYTDQQLADTVAIAEKYFEEGTGWLMLPLPPVAWVKTGASPAEEQEPEGFFQDDARDIPASWSEPKTRWYSEYAAKILKQIPYEAICKSDAREPLLAFLQGVLVWTIEKNVPPWKKKRGRGRSPSQLIEWTSALGDVLGRISGFLPPGDVKAHFLDPIFALEDEQCWALLEPFVSDYVCRYIYDDQVIPGGAIDIIGWCVDRLLQSSAFKRTSHRAGEFYGHHQPPLLRALMFVSIEHASQAARYVNGNWSEIGKILPVVNRIVRDGGWAATVMNHFLTLCERAKQHYPAEMFADQILAVIGDGSESLKGWHGTSIPARIAGLIQLFADRDTPLSVALGQTLLRALDLLVDMGDRRSAALQQSETFREIKIV